MQEPFSISVELKSVLTSAKRVKITNSEVIFEPNDSQASFDFTKVLNGLTLQKIKLSFKRLAGNGRFLIENKEYNVLSKRSQYFEINLSSPNLKIYRDKQSIGDISLQEIILITYQDMSKNKWKPIFDQVKYAGITLVNNKLNAAIGAFIEDDYKIDSITTIPANVYSRSGNKIKFLQSCEIVDLKLKNNFIIKPHQEIFVHREMVSNKIENFESKDKIPINVPIQSSNNHIIYDSSKSKLIPGSGSVHIKTIKQGNQNYIALSKNSVFNFYLSSLKSNIDYNLILTSKKINGNGKIQIQFGSQIENLIVQNNLSEYNIKINTGNYHLALGEHNKLIIKMLPESSTGEVLISKVVICCNQIFNQKNEFINSNNNFSSLFKINNQFRSEDQIKDNFQNYALYPSVVMQNFSDLSSKINFQSRWGQKIRSIFPNLNQDSNANLTICSINSIINSKKIYLEEFDETKNPNLNVQGTEYIFSPSELNVYWLKQKYPTINSLLIPKFWPYVPAQEIEYLKNQNFILCFNRCPEYLDQLFNIDTKLKFVVIGARGSYPDNVIPINEYLSYDKLVWLIQTCQVVLDFPVETNNYYSGLLNLVSDLGKPIITSNLLPNQEHNNQFYIIPELEVNDKLMPNSSEVIKLCQQKLISLPAKTSQEINQKLADTLSLMLNL